MPTARADERNRAGFVRKLGRCTSSANKQAQVLVSLPAANKIMPRFWRLHINSVRSAHSIILLTCPQKARQGSKFPAPACRSDARLSNGPCNTLFCQKPAKVIKRSRGTFGTLQAICVHSHQRQLLKAATVLQREACAD